jgi:tRNA (cmo5U34)-methyltransferase
MSKERIDIVKDHFNSEAGVWDKKALERVPYYREMFEILVSMLPFAEERGFSVIDLGAGTGTISYMVKKAFPAARITCMDIAPQMLEMARKKLAGFKDIEYELADLADYKFKGKYDAVVSSLALHHLEPDENKLAFYRRLYSALNPGGVFLNADIITADDEKTQEIYLKKWGEFVLSNLPSEDMQENLKRYHREDRPNKLNTELDWLRKAGFASAEAHFKYYNFAVYGALKA